MLYFQFPRSWMALAVTTCMRLALSIAIFSLPFCSWGAELPSELQKGPQVATVTPPCPAALNFMADRLQDEKPQNLCQYAGKVVLVVNTASYCGFTPQYKGLEALYDQYKDRGLVVLGFPSNDFSQEPNGNQQIADFCENTYGVKFPMFTKTAVKGSQATPLFKWLAKRTNTTPKWNFYKYLISRDGQSVESFGSLTGPQDRTFMAHVEEALNAKAH